MLRVFYKYSAPMERDSRRLNARLQTEDLSRGAPDSRFTIRDLLTANDRFR